MKYSFADCVLDTETHVLIRAGHEQRVEPQVFDLLELLLRFAGSLVTRDQIIDEVWQGRIVSESAISARIAAARKVVGDEGKTQAIIRTVPRRGLQLVADVVVAGEDAPKADPPVARPRVRFATSDDGVRLAFATSGAGPGLIRVSHFPSHLELDWKEDTEQGLFRVLGQRHTLLRFDQRGSGLSDLEIGQVDFDICADDLRAVADAAGLDRFVVFGSSGSGAATALHFASKYPERVSALMILGGFVDGRSRRGDAPEAPAEPIEGIIREGWDHPDLPFVAAYLSLYFPGAGPTKLTELARLVQAACPRENAIIYRQLGNGHSVAPILGQIKAPTLIIHAQDEAVHPVSEGRKLASGIAGAELAVLSTANHYPLSDEPAWEEFVQVAREFLDQNRDGSG